MTTIYYGHNRLENWYIDQLGSVADYTRSLVANELSDVPETIQELVVPELRSLPSDETTSEDFDGYRYFWRRVGANMVRTGVAILLVPDPIPLVDEIIGVGLIVVGGTIIALS